MLSSGKRNVFDYSSLQDIDKVSTSALPHLQLTLLYCYDYQKHNFLNVDYICVILSPMEL